MNLSEEIPYPGSKPMYLVDTEDNEEISNLILIIIKDLNNSSK